MKNRIMTAMLVLLCASMVTAGQWYIPAAAHADGAFGSVWRTRLMLNNFGDDDEVVTLTLLARGADNGDLSNRVELTVAAGEAVEVEDVLSSLFSFDGAAAIVVDAVGERLVVSSRTYNLATTGTYGQAIPGVSASAAVQAGDQALLVGLSATEGRRTNIGWVSLSPEPITVTIELIDADGRQLAVTELGELPFGHSQHNLFTVLDAPAAATAHAVVSATGAILPYASVVASGSNDPIYVAALRGIDSGTELLIPAAAHVAGAGGTDWTTDLWIYNTGSDPAAITLELWPQELSAALVSVSLPDPLQPAQQLEIKDVIFSVFGLDSTQGALVIRSDSQIHATSRTFNTESSGTFGQFILAQRVSSLAAVGETVYLPGARDGQDFRSNLGLVATHAGSTVEIRLRGGNGVELASTSITLAANEQIQRRLTSLLGVDDISVATVEIHFAGSNGGNGALAAYLSVVDEGTTDPTYVNAARGAGGDPGTELFSTTVLVVNGALSTAVDNAGPTATWPKTDLDCFEIEYSSNDVQPGQSPEGKCWASTMTFDSCSFELPNLEVVIEQDGTVAVDACVIDDYPSTLSCDLTTLYHDLGSGEQYHVGIEGDLVLALAYDGARPESGHLIGEMAVTTNSASVDAWADLRWQSSLLGLEAFPSGVLDLVMPYEIDGIEVMAEAHVTFDGSEIAYVEVRAGYWHTSFYLNLTTGDIIWI